MVSPLPTRILWSREAIRESAASGSPELVERHDQALGHLEVAQVAGHAHVADHRAAHERDLAAVGVRGVEDLLDAVHVAGEAGDDDASRRGAEDVLDGRGQVTLGGREAGHLGVGGVGHEQVDPLLAQPREAAQVGDPAVERELVHLEVAGVQDHAGAGADRHGETVGDGVVDRHELAVEGGQVDPVALLDLAQLGADPVLLELLLDQRQRQARADQRDVGALAEEIGQAADVVLVAVGQHDADDLVEAVTDPGEVGQDHVDAGLVLLGEENPAVDDQQLALVLEDRHVAADLAEAAERHDPQGAGRELRGRLQLGVGVAHSVSSRA